LSGIPTIQEIEEYVLNAGSDHLGTFGGRHEGGIQLQQIADEIAPCIYHMLESGEEIKNYLEIGSAAGGTVVLMNHFFHFENIVLVDDNKHPKAHVRPYILRDIKRQEIIGHSQAEGTIEVINSIKLAFDLILLDGNHTYPGVKQDADNYIPMLRPGGFVIFHDSALAEWGIGQVVRELKNDGRVKFVNDWRSRKHSPPCGVALFQKVK
jgi:predicted O-methyltransferase YrrM